MKVAQITLNGYFNYGNILQKYALHKTLGKFVEDTEVLWFNINNFTPEVDVRRCSCYESARMTKFKEFHERYIKTRFNLPYIEETADEYDFFVVGSDQVWNPNDYTIPYPMRFLEFVPREKKLAYAASIATPKIPDKFKEYFRQGISSFDYISVREEGAVKIIEELTGKTPLLVLDPVLLLTVDEWKKIARPPSWFNEKYSRGYILAYYIHSATPPEIKSIADKVNLPLINLLDSKNFNHYLIGPEEFIFLWLNASLIYSNSFHGITFSILFKRPFINLDYDDSVTKSMSLRIPGLLKMFGLENRVTTSMNNYRVESPLEIDFSTCDKVLPLERAKAFKFLTNALSSNSAEINMNRGGGIDL